MTATGPRRTAPGALLKQDSVFDLAIDLDGRPDALAVMGEARGQAGVRVDVLYSDHDHRLILVTSDQAATAIATKAWDR
jgi:hypothetical protein